MGRLIGGIGMLTAWLCVGTVVAQGVVVGYLHSQGTLSIETLAQAAAVLQGVEVPAATSSPSDAGVGSPKVQPSLDEVAQARALKSRDFELREQLLRNQLERVKYEQSKLEDENDRFNTRRTAFLNELDSLRRGAIATNEENARLILENIKPQQAKQQILKMIEGGEMDDVVTLMSLMPVARRAKIAAEFKTEEESIKLAELLKRVREGVPEVPLINQTERELVDGATPR